MKQIFTVITLLLFLGRISFGQSKFKKEKVIWVAFDWADPDYKDVMLITSRLDTLDYFFRWQLDTGSPYTYLEGGTFKKFTNKFPYLADKIKRVDTVCNGNWYKIFTPPFKFEKQILPSIILKNDKIGGGFSQDLLDKYKGFSIGTIGVDIFKEKVLILDFKNKKIGYCDNLTKGFYKQKISSSPFQFYKNRIILPVQIGNKKINFMYDCGASMFTLNATPKYSKSFAPKQLTDTLYNINNGESGTVYNAVGGKTDKQVKILGNTYKNMTVYLEKGESDIFEEAKVAGAIGNKLFLDHIVIIDFRTKRFSLVD
ncbi:hypothetical protein [Siphonobacter sp. SORGH_AS_1065]|uniref:hypothetical protein n=1 Tax=Siphonobacter sp. SORGH_AS_1065 TaxID=3041795 RepID=UPI002788DF4D|nr:hypothetical protein [Siphonobacter sp. SORGH_AS_1065]MDQ1088430.1 hypothetical protein [Siphonobacter sp. SORGH_AS_1065]